VRVTLFDITGRQVATIHDQVHAAGAVVIPWSGQPSSGGSLRSGIYLMRVESPGESDRSARIAIVR
jgi:flagellar hook assembly protein FlgD